MADITRQLVREQVQKEVARQTAIAELVAAADKWEKQAFDGRYTLAKEVQEYLTSKAVSSRREAARLA